MIDRGKRSNLLLPVYQMTTKTFYNNNVNLYFFSIRLPVILPNNGSRYVCLFPFCLLPLPFPFLSSHAMRTSVKLTKKCSRSLHFRLKKLARFTTAYNYFQAKSWCIPIYCCTVMRSTQNTPLP
jgi:hypothetical protein